MAIFNKFFLRNVLIGGLLWFAISVVQSVVEIGWSRGIIKAVASGLLFGLFMAFLDREDYSKPVYPLDIDRSQFDAEGIQSEFPPEMPSYTLIILLIVLIMILFTIGIYTTRDFTFLIDAPFIVLLIFLMFAYRRFCRIIILQDGIKYRAIIYRIKISWEEIERIEKRGNKWSLIYRSSIIDAVPIIYKLLKVYEVDRRLNLSNLTFNFPKSEMAKAIFYHAKQLPIMSTR